MKTKLFIATLAASATLPAIVSSAYASELIQFNDLPTTHPYYEQIMELQSKDIIHGYPDGTYRPDAPISRKHVVSLLNRVHEFQPIREAMAFKDVPATHPYYEMIQKAYQAGIIDGDSKGYFHPEQSMTRSQMAKVLSRAFQLEGTTKHPFSDIPSAHWSNKYIDALYSYGIAKGDNGLFLPNQFVTRGHYAAFLHRLLELEKEPPINQLFDGKWKGQLTLPQGTLPILLEFQQQTGTLSIPLQGVHDVPIDELRYTKDNVHLIIGEKGMNVEINGKLEDGNINATFTQNGQSFPIVFTPYKQTYETIAIPVKGGNLNVALELPANQTSPSPIAILIAGSGPTNKDGNTIGGAGENNSLKMVAEDLASKGIASIRYDKRGIGENQSLVRKEEELSVEQYVEDVQQIIDYAKTDERVSSIHIIGHSEGSLIGMLAVNDDVASFTSLAGPGRSMEELLLEQLKSQLPPDLLKTTEELLAAIKKGEHIEDVPEILQPLFRPSVQPYLQSLFRYHPAETIRQINVPTFIIQGENDLQVAPKDAQSLHQAKPDAQVLYLKQMNHILKDAPTDIQGNFETYTNPSLPLSEGLIEAMAEFILR